MAVPLAASQALPQSAGVEHSGGCTAAYTFRASMHPTHFNKVLAGANSGEVTAAARSKPQGHHWRLGSPCGAFKTCSSSRTHFVVMHCSIAIIFRYFYSWFIDAVDMASHALQLSQPGCRNTGRSLGGASLAPSGLRSGLMPPHPPSLTVISGSGVAAVGAGIGVGLSPIPI